jgi:hypothetical protein
VQVTLDDERIVDARVCFTGTGNIPARDRCASTERI